MSQDRGLNPLDASGFCYSVTAAELPGTYIWVGALMKAGTMSRIGEIAQAPYRNDP